MTVKELIQFLQQTNETYEVVMTEGKGQTFTIDSILESDDYDRVLLRSFDDGVGVLRTIYRRTDQWVKG